MREHIQSAVQIFRSHPDAEDDEILKLIMDVGTERPLAIQLLLLVPLAYGRVMLSDDDLLFSNTYRTLEPRQQGRLDALPLWAEALEFAKQDREPSFPIASRSAEFRAANAALCDGERIENLIFGPPVFPWPIEPLPRSPGNPKTPGWLRQIWDQPAHHSMSRRTRTAARVAMVIAILVGLSAIGAVAYYGISVLQIK